MKAETMTNHFDSKGGEQKKKRLRLCAVLALLLNCCQADGEKAMENERPSSLASAADAKGDYGTALKYLEQSLVISREIGDKEGEAKTLNNIGHIHFIKVEKDKALSVFEQSLRIMQEIGDKKGEAETLIRIGHLHNGQGGKALQYYEQSLRISQEIGDKKGEDTALNYIWGMYIEQEDYATALKYLEQNLRIMQELGDKAGEDLILNNLAAVAHIANDNHSMTMKYLEQSLRIRQEIGDKSLEEGILWKIGTAYEHQGDLRTAEQYMSRAVQLMEEIGYPKQLQEEYREALEAIRAKIKGQVGGKHRAPFASHQRRRMERAGCLAKSQHARSSSPSLLGRSAPAGCPIVSQLAGPQCSNRLARLVPTCWDQNRRSMLGQSAQQA